MVAYSTILNEVDVSDPEKSRYEFFPSRRCSGYEYGNFVFKKESIEPTHIGREKYSRPNIFISATLKEAFEKAKIKGCQYWEGD